MVIGVWHEGIRRHVRGPHPRCAVVLRPHAVPGLANGAGRFLSAVLRPTISVVEGTDLMIATELHQKVDEYCFIARSVNFPVYYEPTFDVVAC